MICPHCQVAFFEDWKAYQVGVDVDGQHTVLDAKCPACKRLVVKHQVRKPESIASSPLMRFTVGERLVNPFGASSRPQPPVEVPQALSGEYVEASSILHLSPRASAALSRRCLQHTIREAKGIKKGSLEQEIDAVISQNLLQSDLADQLNAVRQIGNFAAHPMKSTQTGDILDVEPGEADWNLDVLDGLFDAWYVQPAKAAARKDALNAKLREAGKPELS